MMVQTGAILLLGLTTSLVSANGLYGKNSPVLQVNAKNYDSLVAQSNHTSIVEFYAPWCGHCQNLKPAYEKAAKNLAGLAKVAAVNCDEEDNKPFCASFGVKGFPTLKIVHPAKKRGKPIVEEYHGAREAKAIVEAVVDRIPNHVKRLKEADVEDWLLDTATPAKAILFTKKGTTSALIRSLAIDFLGSIQIAQVRDTEQAIVDKFGIDTFPSVVLLPGDGQDPIVYSDEMKKQLLVDFLSQVAPPNPDPAPKKVKPSSSTKSAKKPAEASTTASSSTTVRDTASSSSVDLDDDSPTESPLPIVEQDKPIAVPEPEAVPPIPALETSAELDEKCIAKKSGTCILALLPIGTEAEALLPEPAVNALNSLAGIANKHSKRKDHTFPFYSVPAQNERAKTIRAQLGLGQDSDLEIIALNNKRGWWRRYAEESYDLVAIEAFVDAIKLGEGPKQKLPERFGGEEDILDPQEEPLAASVTASDVEDEDDTATAVETTEIPSSSSVPEQETADPVVETNTSESQAEPSPSAAPESEASDERDDTSPEAVSTEDASPEDAKSEDLSPEDASPEDVSSEAVRSEDVSSESTSPKAASSEDVGSESASPKAASSESPEPKLSTEASHDEL
ncbi:hypothetical protein DV738_g167, partial [Chaetothyriales sp. CBS 135597]